MFNPFIAANFNAFFEFIIYGPVGLEYPEGHTALLFRVYETTAKANKMPGRQTKYTHKT